jgi:Type I phosphodiesterase / nucleotide pyrophosphatase
VTAGTLASLSNSIFASLGLFGVSDELGIGASPARRECLLLVDGMGAHSLNRYGKEFNIFSQSISSNELHSHFPTTTTVNLTSLGTGVLPGVHGMLGYTVRVPRSGDPGRLLNALKWDERVDPLTWQKIPTLFERASAQGITTSQISAKRYQDTGFTRAALRGARYIGANQISEIATQAALSLKDENSFSYVYMNHLDVAGHEYGVGSEKWLISLSKVSELITQLRAQVPNGTRIWVTSDHGMVNANEKIILGQDNELGKDILLFGGEPRARHLYLRAGAALDVKTRYQEFLGNRALVLTKSEAIGQGLFGEKVSEDSDERIGDLIVIANGELILIDPNRIKQESEMVGHHGGQTEMESVIPLLAY